MKAAEIFIHIVMAVMVAVVVHYILEALEARSKQTATNQPVVKPDCGCGCGGGCGG